MLALGLSLTLSGVPLAIGISFFSEFHSLPSDVASALAASFLIRRALRFTGLAGSQAARVCAICAGARARLLRFWLFGTPRSRSRVNFLWKSKRQTFAALLALNVYFMVVAASSGIVGRAFTTVSPARGIWTTWLVRDAWQAVFVLLLHLPSFRTTVQSYLTRRGEVMMAAAGVASLLEVCNYAQAMLPRI
ncbi:hypothetical protein T492DRAFT_838775 [Pavlovales sp. CCMP2436]|nr:hypothetical protein T492DRAFT_838775 [Pavlovales sp. CCMP2436]